MMKKLLVEVGELTDQEYARANEQHPAFASDHEGHDVMSEEIDEAEVELVALRDIDIAMKRAILKNDDENVGKIAMRAYDAAQRLAAEAIQAAAMAQKIVKSQELRKNRDWIPPCRLV